MLCVESVNATALLEKNIVIKPMTKQNKFSQGQFKGKTALITGGGTGIGRSAAEAMATEGCLVTVAGRTIATLEETVQFITKNGGSARYAVCDVTDEQAVKAAVDTAIRDTGRLDFAINSAGIDGGDNAMLTTAYHIDVFDKMMATNVRGMFLSMKYEWIQMDKQGFGAIVNISSGAGLVGVAGYSGYSASKHAEIGMTKSSAIEQAAKGIRVNAICPGLVDTPLIAKMIEDSPEFHDHLVASHPIGRIARSSEVADAIIWLCSDRSSYLIGAALPLDGGYTAR
ncbi:MAG: D-beta-hydroxybutyrate dehydrogenase [Mucilaginibacter sp.]|nr:D-beta-hydroxybutyrate dehydrogenase [Mucilaginibacter sp.]